MLELDDKYVFHIPLYTHDENGLKRLDIDELLDKLTKKLEDNGYHSFYLIKAKGYYKSRCFDELLITLFASDDDDKQKPDIIFKSWFTDNNEVLNQESFAYEHNNRIIIEELDIKKEY